MIQIPKNVMQIGEINPPADPVRQFRTVRPPGTSGSGAEREGEAGEKSAGAG